MKVPNSHTRNLSSILLSFFVLISCSSLIAQTTFNTTGNHQYIVPAGVNQLMIEAAGAQGGGTYDGSGVWEGGGLGGKVFATIAVTPGQVLNIVVGGQGEPGLEAMAPGAGGFNGGGVGGSSGVRSGGGGGGSTDVIIDGAYWVIAGGGGGGGGQGGGESGAGTGGGIGGGSGAAYSGTNMAFGQTACGGLGGRAGENGMGGMGGFPISESIDPTFCEDPWADGNSGMAGFDSAGGASATGGAGGDSAVGGTAVGGGGGGGGAGWGGGGGGCAGSGDVGLNLGGDGAGGAGGISFAHPNATAVDTDQWGTQAGDGFVTITESTSADCAINATLTIRECMPGTLTYTFMETAGEATEWYWLFTDSGGSYAEGGVNASTFTVMRPVNNPLSNISLDAIGPGCTATMDLPNDISPPPVATASSNSPIVETATIQLMENGGEAVSWSWTGPNGFTSMDQNPSIPSATMAMAGDYTVTITTADGCTAESTTTVVINAAGPCNINATVTAQECTPGSVTYTFTENGGDAVSWLWSFDIIDGGGTNFSDMQNFTLENWTGPEFENPMFISVTCADGGTAEQDVFWTLDPPPTATATSNSPVIENEEIQLMETGGQGATWAWAGPDGFTSMEQNPTIPNATLAMAGDYTVTVTTTGGCMVESTTTVVIEPACGMTCPMAAGPFAADDCVEFTLTETDLNLMLDAGWSVSNISQTDFVTTGIFDVTVTADNGAGTSCDCTIPITIDPPEPYTITTTLLTLESCVGGSVSFTNADIMANVTVSNGHPVEIEQLFPLNPADGTLTDDGNGNYIWSPSTPFPTSMGLLYVLRPTDNCPNITVNGEITVNAVAPMINVVSNNPLTEGDDIMLAENAGEAVSWNWEGPEGFTSIEQAPNIQMATVAMSGNYSVTIEDAMGCQSSAVIPITVNPVDCPPPFVTISSNSPVTEGQTILLMETAGEAVMWEWTGPNGFFSADQNPSIPNATSAMSGDYVVTITDINGCVASASTNVMVETCNIPAVNATANSPVPNGGTITLFENGGEAVTWSWVGPNGFVSNEQNPTIPNALMVMTGTYEVTIMNTAGCSASASVQVAVGDDDCTYTISAPTAVFETCVGGFLTWTNADLMANVSTSNGHPVEVQDVYIQNPADGTFTDDGNGNYTFAPSTPFPTTVGFIYVVRPVDDCPSGFQEIAQIQVNVGGPMINLSSNSPLDEGQTINLMETGGEGTSWAWQGPDGFTSNDQNPTISNATLTMAGYYTVTVTDAGGCTSTSTIPVTVNMIGCTAPVINISSNSPVNVGDAITLGENGGAAVNWAWQGPNGFTSNDQNPIIPNATLAMSGFYGVSITDANGCFASAAIPVTVMNAPCPTPAVNVTSNSPVNIGGTITMFENGGEAILWSWTGPNGFTSNEQNPSIPNATMAMAGTYEVTITNATGCTATATVQVSVGDDDCDYTIDAPPIIFETCVSGTITFTNADIMAFVSVSNGHPVEVSNVWLNNPSDGTFTDNGDGTYTFMPSTPFPTSVDFNYVITPVDNCPAGFQAIGIMDVEVNAPALILASNSPVTEGDDIMLTETGGEASSWMWSGPNSFTSGNQNPAIANTTLAAAGLYNLTATDADGCTSEATIPVAVNEINCTPPILNVSSNSPVAEGDDLMLMENGGEATSWQWNGPNGFISNDQNPTITAVSFAAAGTYTLLATSTPNCSTTSSVNVAVNAVTCPAQATPSSSGDVCPGESVQLFANTNIGSGASYSWIGPSGFTSTDENPVINPAVTGVYTLTISNATCSASGQIDVLVLDDNLTAEVLGGNCPGGDLTLSTNFSSPNATYAWSGPNGFSSSEETPVITGASAANDGTYSVTVTLPGCSDDASVDVTVAAGNANITPTSNSPVCTGLDLNLMAGDGTNFMWTGPNGFSSSDQNPTIAAAQPNASGTYSLMMTDQYGCSGSADLMVEVGDDLTAMPTSSGDVCPGEAVQLMANTNLGAGSTYSWNGPSGFMSADTDPVINPAVGGTYFLMVQNGTCSASGQIDVLVLDDNLTAEVLGGNCPGGDLTLSTNFSSPNATYAWSGPNGFSSSDEQPVITGASAANDGTYSVTVTLPGCSDDASVDVTVAAGNANITPTSNSPVCTGLDLNLMAGDGTNFMWTGPNGFFSTDQNPTIAAAQPNASGTYSLMMTDQYGCSGSADLMVEVGDDLTAMPTSSGDVCPGEAVQLMANTNLGAGSTYSWNGPSGFMSADTDPVINPAVGGTYNLMVVNGSCMANGSVEVQVFDGSTPLMPSHSGDICPGETIELMANLANASNFTFSWTGPNGFTSTEENPMIANAPAAAAGTYNLIASNGSCSAQGQVSVVVLDDNLTAMVSGGDCAGGDLTLTTNISSASATYSWAGPDGFTSNDAMPVISNASAANEGSYNVTVTLSGGCSDDTTVDVTLMVSSPLAMASSNSPVCTAMNLELMASDGASFVWTGPNGFMSMDQNPILANAMPNQSGTYELDMIDNFGCMGRTFINVIVGNNLTAMPQNNGTVCPNTNLNLEVQGLGNGSTYTWTGPNSFTSNEQNPVIAMATGVNSGVYEVTVSNGTCSAQGSTTAEVLDMDPMPMAQLNSTFCEGHELMMTATPTYNNATYAWTGPNNFNQQGESYTIPVLSTTHAGQYNLKVTLMAGCEGETMFDIMVNPAPTVMATSDSPVCADGILMLQETGGQATSWSWTGGGFSSSDQNPMADASLLVGVTEIQLIGYDNLGCTDSLMVPIQIDTLPLPMFTGLDPNYCKNNAMTITLDGNFNGGMYMITDPGSAGLNDQNNGNAELNPSQIDVGIYTITYSFTNANGCAGEVMEMFEVYDSPAVNLEQMGKACDNFSDVVLTEIGGTAVSWEWSGPGGFSSMDQSPVLPTPVTEGTYEVMITDQFGCVNTADTLVEVFMGMAFVANFLTPTQACLGDTVHFFEISAANITPTSIMWDFGDSNTSTLRDPIHQYTAGGQYNVMVEIFDDECGNVSLTKPIEILNCLNIGGGSAFNDVNIFPNPTQEEFTVDIEMLVKSDVLIEIFNARGQKIQSRLVEDKSTYQASFEIDLPGIYFVKVRSIKTNSYEIRKIVVTQ